MKIWEMPVAIIVWTQDECYGCEEYKPKFMQVAQEYQGCLPVIIADVDRFPAAADAFQITSTPTTIITRYGQRGFGGFISGDAPIERIRRLFTQAVAGLNCSV